MFGTRAVDAATGLVRLMGLRQRVSLLSRVEGKPVRPRPPLDPLSCLPRQVERYGEIL